MAPIAKEIWFAFEGDVKASEALTDSDIVDGLNTLAERVRKEGLEIHFRLKPITRYGNGSGEPSDEAGEPSDEPSDETEPLDTEGTDTDKSNFEGYDPVKIDNHIKRLLLFFARLEGAKGRVYALAVCLGMAYKLVIDTRDMARVRRPTLAEIATSKYLALGFLWVRRYIVWVEKQKRGAN